MSKLSASISKNDLNYIEKLTNLNSEKIAQFYQEFLKSCPFGYLSRDDFKNVFSKKLLDVSSADNTRNKEEQDLVIERLFQMCDVDSNGFVDFKEYIILFWSRATGNLDDKLALIFDIVDSDKNGHIDFYELHKIVKILYKLKKNDNDLSSHSPPHLLDEPIDMDKSYVFYRAYNNKNNQTNLLTPSYYLTFDIMKKFDVNKNGKLSKAEFISGCKNNEEIRKFLSPL